MFHLKVKDQQGSETRFMIKKTTPLRKMMAAYCSREGLQASQIRFVVEGQLLAPDHTAEKLGLEDDAIIAVVSSGKGLGGAGGQQAEQLDDISGSGSGISRVRSSGALKPFG